MSSEIKNALLKNLKYFNLDLALMAPCVSASLLISKYERNLLEAATVIYATWAHFPVETMELVVMKK